MFNSQNYIEFQRTKIGDAVLDNMAKSVEWTKDQLIAEIRHNPELRKRYLEQLKKALNLSPSSR